MNKPHLALLTVLLFSSGAARFGQATEVVRQSPRSIPLVRTVDVVVVGGATDAVAAAIEAANGGASVFLAAPRTYLGEDLCGTLHLWLEDGEEPVGRLAAAVFSPGRTTTPLKVKRAFEAALLDAGVDFLLACYPTDLLTDARGRPAGVVIGNRAGRQAIAAKVVIDGTDSALLARLAGATRRTQADGRVCCRRVVLGGTEGAVSPGRTLPAGITFRGQDLFYYEYTLPVESDETRCSFHALVEAEQAARDRTYREGQLRAAERITVLGSGSIRGSADPADWPGLDNAGTDAFRPERVERLYVLSAMADVPERLAAQLLTTTGRERVGQLVGRAAAQGAAELSAPDSVTVPGTPPADNAAGDVREQLNGLRPTGTAQHNVPQPATEVPVLARVDVAVIGGGTSGACAAIAAARQGAAVLVAEFQEGLGGVGTLGLIGRPYHGLSIGFTREVPFPDTEHNTEHKMEWFRREIRKAGGKIWCGKIWCGVLGCGVYVSDGRVRGAVLATPAGRGVVLADVVVDATGNADLAAPAGADVMYGGDGAAIALQGTGLPLRPLGNNYVNTDYLLVDEADTVDVWRALVGVRLAADADAYDIGPLIQNRERRRVVGDHVMTYLDQIAGRTYPDSIVYSGSDYDSHGYPSEFYFALIPHTEKTLRANHPAPGGKCYTPYRCLLPRGVEGLLVIGLGISMHRDATALVRMQRDMHNQGYAAGVAAAMAARDGCTPRQIDVRELQEHLVQIGNLPESVLTDVDSFPLASQRLCTAVAALADPRYSRDQRCRELAAVLTHREQAHPMLQEAFYAADGEARLMYAKILGFCGDREAVPVLVDALQDITAWDDRILQGKMAEYAHLPTPIDALILALGHTGDTRALPAILDKLQMLDAGVTLSHHRAVALALEQLGDPAAAAPLAALLDKPGLRGHAMTNLEPLYDREKQRRRRLGPLREIVLARALYHCGDHQGLGRKILEEYRHDLRGLFARHASAVLGGPPIGERD